MSAVTKVLIIVLVVLCVAFSMTAIAFVAHSNNWKELAEDFMNEAQIADAHLRSATAAHAAELASARDSIRGLNDRMNGLIGELETSMSEVSRKQGEITRLEADKQQADALAQRLTNELGIAQAGRVAVEGQRAELETRNIELERRNIDLNDRVNELTTRVTVLVQQQRQQAQQIAILRDENQKISQQVGVPVSGAASSLQPAGMASVKPLGQANLPKISGHVVGTEGNFVTISVGSADLVKPGSVFVIIRDGKEYVADIEITDIEPNLSAGRILRSAQGFSPQQGDEAHDEYSFLSGR